ncbi:hypothetical protein GGI43DRAFT_394879 [Trichoderma evansii]
MLKANEIWSSDAEKGSDDEIEHETTKPFLGPQPETLSCECSHSVSQKKTNAWPICVAIVCILAIVAIISIPTTTLSATPSKRPKSTFSSKALTLDVHESSPTKTNSKLHPCGNSSAQARQLGCRFDQLTWSWLPPNCPSYASDEFMEAAEAPWVFYEDLEATKVAEGEVWEQVLDGELGVFGERREHVTHCIFMFLGLAQILRDKTVYHDKYGDYEHSRHCAYLLLDAVKKLEDWNDLDTYTGTTHFDQSCGQN